MSSPPPDPAALAAAAAAFHQFTVEAFTLLAIGIAITVLRTFARVRFAGWRGLSGDDYLAWLAILFYIAETCLAYSVGNAANGLANNNMTDEQRAALSPDDPEYHLRVLGSKIQIAGWSTYSTLLWTLKTSLLIFYIRLTDGLARHYRIRIYIGFAFLAASYIVVALNLYLSCRPFHKLWQIYPDPGNVCQPAISNQIIWVYWAFNVTTDLYIISIPLPMLWTTSLKPWRKIGLIFLFSGGLFVVVCATLRCALIVLDTANGAQLAGSWAVRETFVAVVTTNLPMLVPLLKMLIGPFIGSILSSRRSTQKLEDATPKDLVTFGGSSKSWRGRGPPTANPITNITINESEEHIVGDVRMQDLKVWSDGHNENQQLRADEDNRNIRKRIEIDIVSANRLNTERG
ncbi:uncharacterized protein TRIVIDRAFT_213239 [Trichoderma virens Gv29-8]|uniref:Rhodopsin domain-containing protein n=1 Tax=Hypocrea virens (strain Gv29-8 / FGSC 10586) TaxID=413071 RepID=G9MWP9_HYPVG|nr:uncharacterized protein TRIVIDRAFT_213239 [Trichoderma virens Gv29-8]EHK21037.1 hypothetical protein TRIVIDRAFT_213239 [Trichoderma virens Gv29-8]UKZ49104.1 hypothetical protein TrVGV298_003343 [Trichoderma virens]